MKHTGSCHGFIRSFFSVFDSRPHHLPAGSLVGKHRGQQGNPRAPLHQYRHSSSNSSGASSSSSRAFAITNDKTLMTPARRTLLTANCTLVRAGGTHGAGNLAMSGGGSGVRSGGRGLLTSSSDSSMSPLETGRAPVECGAVSPRRMVPGHVPKTPYYATGVVPPSDNFVSGCKVEVVVACVLAGERFC